MQTFFVKSPPLKTQFALLWGFNFITRDFPHNKVSGQNVQQETYTSFRNMKWHIISGSENNFSAVSFLHWPSTLCSENQSKARCLPSEVKKRCYERSNQSCCCERQVLPSSEKHVLGSQYLLTWSLPPSRKKTPFTRFQALFTSIDRRLVLDQ